MTNIDFLTKKFNHIFKDYSTATIYLNAVPEHLENSNFQITGKVLETDDSGVVMAFLYNGNEIRVYLFPLHTIMAVQLDASEVVDALRENDWEDVDE